MFASSKRHKKLFVLKATHISPSQRFYYADERTPSGLPVMRDISGDAAGTEYLKLVNNPLQQSWLYTYTANEGYVDFGEKAYLKTTNSDEPRFLEGGR